MPNKQQTYNPYHQPNPEQIISLTQATEDDKQKKPIVRRTVDYHTTIINYLETRPYFRTFREFRRIYPTSNAIRFMRPIPFEKGNEAHGFCTKYVSTSINKHKCAINCLIWSPEGRRLITGNAMGQFTLWNGLKFNFDTILPAHEYPIRRMIWKYDDEILVSSDSRGYIKYWTMNMKNLLNKRGHDESINDMCFSPSYCKFASASADGYLKIWDFSSCKTESATRGHGWDVTCIDWHPYKSIVASGSKDNLIKLWCPKSGECLRSLHGHKNTVSCLKINKINGNWLISGSKDQLIKLWDLRMLGKGEFDTIRAEIDELSCLSWHPHYEKLFVAGGKSGDIKYFIIGNSHTKKNCQAEIHKAHEQIIWDFAWHPLGHILASSSNDQTTRFWTRNRPGDDMNDQYNVNQLTGASKQAALRQLAIATKHNPLGTGRTTKPLTEIGGVNLEEIINTEENMEVADDPLINDSYLRGGNKPKGKHGSISRTNKHHHHHHHAQNLSATSNTNIHPERMSQMNPQHSSITLPGMPNIPAMSHRATTAPTLPPPHAPRAAYPPHGPPPNAAAAGPVPPPHAPHGHAVPFQPGPAMHHHPNAIPPNSYGPPPSHLQSAPLQPGNYGGPPMQPPPPGPHGHGLYGTMRGMPPPNMPPQQSMMRGDDRGRYDRDRSGGRRGGGRGDRRDRRDRSRSRDRERSKGKKRSTVPGLSRIFGK